MPLNNFNVQSTRNKIHNKRFNFFLNLFDVVVVMLVSHVCIFVIDFNLSAL